ncbi:MAG: hypothetical protein N2112_04520 [Gemmataceae bacterium]|nr:hypothetical protein [Gemmataceae bacterium]
MASTYTLDEAAQKLNVTVEEFRRRLREDWKTLRSFRDGSTLRFRAQDIDELARKMGAGSSDLQLNIVQDEPEENADPDIIRFADEIETPQPKNGGQSGILKKSAPKPPANTDDEPLKFDSDEIILLPEDSDSSSSKPATAGKSGSDSDVRLEQISQPRTPSSDSDDAIVLTDEIELPSTGGSGKLSSGKSGKLSPGKSGILASGSKKSPAPEEDSSEFELSLEEDSSEFELSLEPESSEEISLDLPASEKGTAGGRSGININKPKDSGPSLEKKGKSPPANDSDEDIDFELSLDTPGASSKKITGKQKAQYDSESEFELTLEDPSDLSLELETTDMPSSKPKAGGDIFEATDFEIPAIDDDSASEVVSLDDADTDLDSSEFDLALDEGDTATEDESSSQVVALDESDLDLDEEPTENLRGKKGKGKGKKRIVDEDLDLGDMDLEEDASSALADVSVDDEDDFEPQGRGETVYVEKTTPSWGVFPVLFMLPTFIIVLLGGLLGWEMVRGAWGYTQPTPQTAPLTKAIAGALELEMKEFDK